MKVIKPLLHDDDDEVRDGEGVHVPIVMMDGIPRTAAFDAADNHQPGYRRMSDADATLRETSYQRYKAELSDAWRRPPNATPPATVTTARSAGADDRRAARDQYIQRTCDAWRTAGRAQSTQDVDPTKPDLSAANAVQQQMERWQGRDLADLANEVEARRRAVHAEFSERLSKSWRAR